MANLTAPARYSGSTAAVEWRRMLRSPQFGHIGAQHGSQGLDARSSKGYILEKRIVLPLKGANPIPWSHCVHRHSSVIQCLARHAGHLLRLAFALTLWLQPRPLYAVETLCPSPNACDTPAAIVWVVTTMQTTVTPEAGGLMADSDGRLSIKFPPRAVARPLRVAVTSTLTTSQPVESTLHAMGYFSLAASDAGGALQALPKAPWTLTFTYADCGGEAGCLPAQVDEASLRCLRRDLSQSKWLPVNSAADVFANRVTCSTNSFGQFALVAEPLRTDAESDQSSVYLPLLWQ